MFCLFFCLDAKELPMDRDVPKRSRTPRSALPKFRDLSGGQRHLELYESGWFLRMLVVALLIFHDA